MMEIVSPLAMFSGFLIQNYAEWRAGGPKLPDTKFSRRFLPPFSDLTRLLALLIVSLIVAIVIILPLVFGAGWLIVVTASALAANATFQLIISLFIREAQPGTYAGLIFMLPTSLWVIGVTDSRYGCLPIVAGPFLSVPLLIAVWWLAYWVSSSFRKHNSEIE